MSDRDFTLTVVTPDNSLLKDVPVTAVGAIGTEGAFTALPGHVPFLTDLKPGLLWYRSGSGDVDEELFVSGGFIEVLPTRITVLADSAERTDEIDLDRAQKARERAAKILEDAKKLPPEEKNRIDIHRAEMSLQRAMKRITTVGHSKNKSRH